MTGAHYFSGWYLLDVSGDMGATAQVEKDFKNLMMSEQAALRGNWTIRFAYDLAFDEEISRSISGDIPLVGIAFALILTATVLSQLFRAQPSLSSARLGAWGMLGVALSVAAGYGIVIWCGVPFTSLAQIGPFILLGVGVDGRASRSSPVPPDSLNARSSCTGVWCTHAHSPHPSHQRYTR